MTTPKPPAGRIRWSDDGLSGNYAGHVGTCAEPGFRLFSPDGWNLEWLLSVRLFAGTKFFRGPDPDDLKAEAERWLEQFIASLGAVFEDDIWPPLAEPPKETGQ